MAQKTASGGLSLAGKGFFGSLCAGTFSLGVWQTQRYYEKQDMIAERQQALSKEPLTHFTFDRHDFHRMRIKGKYLYEKECLVGPRSAPLGALPEKSGSAGGMSPSPMGYFVLTPFQLSDGDGKHFVMVNRGWIPRFLVHDDRHPNKYLVPFWERPTKEISLTCITTPTEKPRIIVPEHKMNGEGIPELLWMDFTTLQEYVKSDSDPDTIMLSLVTAVQDEQQEQQDNETSQVNRSFPVAPPLKSLGEFKTSPMIHVGYAATWYGLATAGMVMTRMLILRK